MAEGGRKFDGLREVVGGVEGLRVVDLDEKLNAAKVKKDLNCVQLHKKAYDKKVTQLYIVYVDLFGAWRVEMFGKVMEERDRLLEWLKNEREKVFLIKDDEEKRKMEVTLKQEEKEMENFLQLLFDWHGVGGKKNID